jgi:Fe-S oxidoreductase
MGTGFSGGSIPVRGGVVLVMTRFNRILEIDTENLIAIAEPGVVTGDFQKEAAVARGKVSLIRSLLSEGIGYSDRLSTYLLQCLGCGACAENCPNGVRADELILAIRALMVEKKGLSLPRRLIFRQILNSVYLLPMLLKTGSLLQGLLSKKVPKESGLHLRFSLPYLDKDRLILPSPPHSFSIDFRRRWKEKRRGERLDYFPDAASTTSFRRLVKQLYDCSLKMALLLCFQRARPAVAFLLMDQETSKQQALWLRRI